MSDQAQGSDTELFELCKAVYEATGWDDTDNYRLAHTSIPVPPKEDLPAYEIREGKEFKSEYWTHKKIPLYTSGYLLEKLLPITAISFTRPVNGKLRLFYNPPKPDYNDYETDTPLKALLKLTLALHKEKLL